jgi:kynureninase
LFDPFSLSIHPASMNKPEFTNLEQAAVLARELDEGDPLGGWRERFHIPRDERGGEQAYFCGNSLGLQPKATRAALEADLDMWAERAVEGHFEGQHPWMPAHEFLREPLARLVGAKPHEVVAMNSLTVNLHLMMVSFYRPEGRRRKILIEAGAFPSDRHAACSQVIHHGGDPDRDLIELEADPDSGLLDDQRIIETIEEQADELALVLLPGVQYRTGQLFDIVAITAAARRHGIPVGWDLAHAAGNVPLKLNEWDCDFAAWCHYKYCNSGPGAVAGCFVHERHGQVTDLKKLPRFAGWWGHDAESRFRMGPEFHASPGADAWQLSNPPILALTPVRVATEMFAEAGMDALREKSEQMTGFLEAMVRRLLAEHVGIITPAEPQRRGCQLSLRITHPERSGREVFDHLTRQGIVGDWREPDVIRVAPVPMYSRYDDCLRLVEALMDSL